MARTRGILKYSGKLGDEVHVDSGTYGHHVRKAVQPGQKKNETALQLQNRRTAYLNKMASEINHVVKHYAGEFKPGNFYQRLSKQFRKAEQDNRIHLLLQLKEMEVNTRYPLHRTGVPVFAVKPGKNKLETVLSVKHRPVVPKLRSADCYYYEVVLLTWGANEKPPQHQVQYSDWCALNEGLPEFVFEFKNPGGTVHWLLAARIHFGQANQVIGKFEATGMQFIDAGTLHQKEAKHLAELEAARKSREQEILKGKSLRKAEPVRVKARRMG